MMIAGVFDSFGTVAAQNIIQRRTPNLIQSRVSAALDAVVLGAMAASFALGAPLIALFGAQGTYLVSAAITLVGAIILLPTMRRHARAGQRRAPHARAAGCGAADASADPATGGIVQAVEAGGSAPAAAAAAGGTESALERAVARAGSRRSSGRATR